MAIVGGVALAFAVGLTVGSRTRPAPARTTTFGAQPTGTPYELGPPSDASEALAWRWAYFRAPDGNLFEITHGE